MNLSKNEGVARLREWLILWNEHDLEGVMSFLHDDVVFENWTGISAHGKKQLQKVWSPWFLNHGDFRFIEEDVFFDVDEQKMLLKWRLEWPSNEKLFRGKPEIRRGVDVLYFKDGKIFQKQSYSKTTLEIEGTAVSLLANG